MEKNFIRIQFEGLGITHLPRLDLVYSESKEQDPSAFLIEPDGLMAWEVSARVSEFSNFSQSQFLSLSSFDLGEKENSDRDLKIGLPLSRIVVAYRMVNDPVSLAGFRLAGSIVEPFAMLLEGGGRVVAIEAADCPLIMNICICEEQINEIISSSVHFEQIWECR